MSEAVADSLLAGGDVIDMDLRLLEAGNDDAGEVVVVFDEEDLSGTVAPAKDTAEFGKEQMFVEGFLHPTLCVAGHLTTEDGGEDAEDDDGNRGRGGGTAQVLQGLPTAEAGHVEIEENGFDTVLCREGDGLLAGGRFEALVTLLRKVFADDGADVGVVVADEDATFADGKDGSGNEGVRRAGGTRQHDVEGSAGTEVALRPDGSGVLLNDGSADGKAETGAALLASVGGLNLLETIEDVVELVSGDTAALVGDAKEDGVRGGLGLNANRGGAGRKLDCIGEQVGEDLQDAIGVGVEEEAVGGACRGEIDMNSGGIGHGRHGVDGGDGEFMERASAELQGSAPGLHSFEVEDVVNEANQAVGIGDGDAKEVLCFGIERAHDTRGEQAEGAADAGERSAQLMRDGGDELVLEGVEHGAFVEALPVLLDQIRGGEELISEGTGATV